MSATLTRAWSAPTRKKSAVIAIAVPLMTTAMTIASLRLLEPSPFVPLVKIQNASGFLIDVDVTSGERSGWVAVGIARPRTTSTVREVLDQGRTWIFRFRSAGIHGGELAATRSDLERAHWTIAVPGGVIKRLRHAGATASAEGGI